MLYQTASAANCPTCGTLVTCVADAPGIPHAGTCPACGNVVTKAAQQMPAPTTFGAPGMALNPTSYVPVPIDDQVLPDSDRVPLGPVDFNEITGEEPPKSEGGPNPFVAVSDGLSNAVSSVTDAVSNLIHPAPKAEPVAESKPVEEPEPVLPLEKKSDAKG